MTLALIRECFLQWWLGEVVEGVQRGQSQKSLHFDGEDPSEAQSQLHYFFWPICDGGDCLRARGLRSCSGVSSQHSLFQVVILNVFTACVLPKFGDWFWSHLWFLFGDNICNKLSYNLSGSRQLFLGEANLKFDSVYILLVIAGSKWKLAHLVKMNFRLREDNLFLTKAHATNWQVKNSLFSWHFAGFRKNSLVFGYFYDAWTAQ